MYVLKKTNGLIAGFGRYNHTKQVTLMLSLASNNSKHSTSIRYTKVFYNNKLFHYFLYIRLNLSQMTYLRNL